MAVELAPKVKSALSKDLNFKDWQRMSHGFANALTRQAARMGTHMTHDDAFSEISYVWVLCRNGFDPSRGFQFATYFTRAVGYNMRLIVTKFRSGSFMNAVQIDQAVCTDDGEGDSLADRLMDANAINPEHAVVTRCNVEALEHKAPLLAALLRLINEAPEELMRELEAAKAQFAFARTMKIEGMEMPPAALTPNILMQIFRFNWRNRARLRAELQEAASYV